MNVNRDVIDLKITTILCNKKLESPSYMYLKARLKLFDQNKYSKREYAKIYRRDNSNKYKREEEFGR